MLFYVRLISCIFVESVSSLRQHTRVTGLTKHGLQTMTTKLTAILLFLLLFTASTQAQSNRTWSFGAGLGPSFGVNESELRLPRG